MNEPRVMLGVPGLDEVFHNKGILGKGIVLIVGPPGSGKTFLAMQLLYDMYPLGQAYESYASRGWLWNCDQRETDLLQLRNEFLYRKGSISKKPVTIQSLRGKWSDVASFFVRSSEHPLDRLKNLRGFNREVRDLALEMTIEDALNISETATAIGIDGLLSLKEFRGMTAEDRRDALQQVFSALRFLLKSRESLLAAVVTMELPRGQEAIREHQFEEYLADVVIRVDVEKSTASKRRRVLEVKKARCTQATMGNHSLWIMDPSETERRVSAASRLGWTEAVVRAAIRPGVVVFPRMRWYPQQRLDALSPQLENVLIEVRSYLSYSDSDLCAEDHILCQPETVRLMSRVLRGVAVDAQDRRQLWSLVSCTCNQLVADLAVRITQTELRQTRDDLSSENGPSDGLSPVDRLREALRKQGSNRWGDLLANDGAPQRNDLAALAQEYARHIDWQYLRESLKSKLVPSQPSRSQGDNNGDTDQNRRMQVGWLVAEKVLSELECLSDTALPSNSVVTKLLDCANLLQRAVEGYLTSRLALTLHCRPRRPIPVADATGMDNNTWLFLLMFAFETLPFVTPRPTKRIVSNDEAPARPPESSTDATRRNCTFGITGLDEMFSPHNRMDHGVTAASSTLIVGGPGTGKSTLAYCFAISGLNNDDDVIFLSFDERYKRILRDSGKLTVEQSHAGTADEALRPTIAPTLANSAAKQVLRADMIRNRKDIARFQFIYENPTNADLDQIMHLLTREMEHGRLGLGSLGRDEKCHTHRHCRLIVDSIADLERNQRDPLLFNDFVITLLNKAVDWGVTVLLTYEAAALGLEEQPRSERQGLSYLADNVVVLRHIDVNNATRKCVSIQKARGRNHDRAARELIFGRGRDSTFYVAVRKGFEGMAHVLTGHPVPANIEVRLFHENIAERQSNEDLIEDLRSRFGDRVHHVPFSLQSIRRIFWDREEGRDVRPDADVTVISLDEPWVRIFALMDDLQRSPLSKWDPDTADPAERLLVCQLDRRLRRLASVEADLAPLGSKPSGSAAMQKMIAMPYYFDLGLLLKRTDLVPPDSEEPTHWDEIPADYEGLSRQVIAHLNQRSFERIVTEIHQDLGVPGFAFNMSDVETVACVFLELCWNFFADPDFLLRRKGNEEDDKADQNIQLAADALEFLWRLRWSGVLPFPCTVEDCANAAYVRAWYANIPNMLTCLDPPRSAPWKPIPFLTSALQFSHRFKAPEPEAARAAMEAVDCPDRWKAALHATGPERSRLMDWVRFARSRLLEERDRFARRRDAPGGDPSYARRLEDTLHAEHISADLRRIGDRLSELYSGKPSSSIGGWSCSGAWFLGVLSSGANANLGWSIVKEALDSHRMEKRALAGAGLPISRQFYREHPTWPVPGLADTTFGYLDRQLLGRVRSREEALHLVHAGGYALETPERIATSETGSPDVKFLSEMPEVLCGLVMHVLADDEFRPKTKEHSTMTKEQRDKLIDEILLVRQHALRIHSLDHPLPPKQPPDPSRESSPSLRAGH